MKLLDITRIGIFSTWDRPASGITKYSEHLVSELKRKGIRVFHYDISSRNYLNLLDRIIDNNLDLVCLNYIQNWYVDGRQQEIKTFFEKLNKESIPTVVISHEEADASKSFPYNKEWRYQDDNDILSDATQIIVHKKPQILKLPSVNILPFPCPANTNKAYSHKTALRIKYGYRDNQKIITTHGVLDEHRKKICKLLEYFVPQLKADKHICLQLLTAEPDYSPGTKEQINILINENKLHDQITFIPDYLAEDEKNERISISNIAFIWCDIEQNSASSAQAQFLSCRVPMVLNDNIHFDFYGGAIRAANNYEDFTKTVIKMAHNDSELKLHRNRLEKIYQKTNWPHSVNRYVDIFKTAKNKIAYKSHVATLNSSKTLPEIRDAESILICGERQMSLPLLSVVLPTYNRPKLIKHTIMSVLNQNDFDDYEFIIVDDHPTRPSEAEQTIKSFSSNKISYYRNQNNLGGGMVGNWNRCLELARGKWITMIHDDDVYYPDFLKSMRPLLNNDKYDLITNYCHQGKEPPLNYPAISQKELLIKKLQPLNYAFYCINIHLGTIFKRDKALSAGGFNEKFFPVHDHEFFARYCLYYNRSYYTNLHVAFFRQTVGVSNQDHIRIQTVEKEIQLRRLLSIALGFKGFYPGLINMATDHTLIDWFERTSSTQEPIRTARTRFRKHYGIPHAFRKTFISKLLTAALARFISKNNMVGAIRTNYAE